MKSKSCTVGTRRMCLSHFSAVWVLVVANAIGGEPNAVVRLQELVLPAFELEGATLEEGLAEIEAAWSKEHPGQSFPVIVSKSLDFRPGNTFFSTIKLTRVSALSALTYLAEIYGMYVEHGLDRVVVRPRGWGEESSWRSVVLKLSERSMRELGLSPEESGEEGAIRSLEETLTMFGLSFAPGFGVYLLDDGKQIIMCNTPQEISKLEALVMLFDNGYSVNRPDFQPDGEHVGGVRANRPEPVGGGGQESKPEVEKDPEASGCISAKNGGGIVHFQELVLPELILDDATVGEALDEIWKVWEKEHPGLSFPIAVVEIDRGHQPARTCTMELRDVPAPIALQYIAELCGLTIHRGLDLVILSHFYPGSRLVSIGLSDRAIQALKLSTDPGENGETSRVLTETLTKLGLSFDDHGGVHWNGARWDAAGQMLVASCYPPRHGSRLEGLLMLIEAGFSIVGNEGELFGE